MTGPNHTGSKSLLITVPPPGRFLPSACGPFALLSLREPPLSATPSCDPGGCSKLMTLLTLSLATAPRCCGTWRSVAWRAPARRLWQKAWQWCGGPRACLRIAQRTREPRS